jgi:hypothetical protein
VRALEYRPNLMTMKYHHASAMKYHHASALKYHHASAMAYHRPVRGMEYRQVRVMVNGSVSAVKVRRNVTVIGRLLLERDKW